MSARDVIAGALDNTHIDDGTIHAFNSAISTILEALTTAGYRILGPDELKTIRDAMQMAISSMEGNCEAHHKIALNTLDRALRSLSPEAPQPEAKEARE